MRHALFRLALASILLSTGCDDTDSPDKPASAGAPEAGDGSEEDGSEDDGSEEDDSEDATTDADGDGYDDSLDCDDADAAVNPGADELCNGFDDDCDGLVDDEDSGVIDLTTWYPDADSDGHGSDEGAIMACAAPSGHVELGGDCDDGDPLFHPGATEDDCTDPNDYNCDGTTGHADADADGYPACEDCNDGAASVFPGADEYCDGLDNDCNGTTDDEAVDALTWYADSDSDGRGDAATSVQACSQPSGTVADATDCDDDDANTWPGAPEYCDGVDTDCDGTEDEDDALDAPTWYIDSDVDAYGSDDTTRTACAQPSGFVANDDDCDDDNAVAYPGATELCDEADNDCDGDIDEDSAADAGTWYIDYDSDGYGSDAYTTVACAQPSGWVNDNTDCDDTSGSVYPGAIEYCDGTDNNCDGTADGSDAIDTTTWYDDADEDGYGDAGAPILACSQPSGAVTDDTDCDDDEEEVFPGADELCNGEDDDCDGTTDEDDAIDVTTWYFDSDGDGYGDPSNSIDACNAPSSYVADDNDCNDDDITVALVCTPGMTAADAALSCAEILSFDSTASDGVYWLDPDGDTDTSDAFEVYCDMTSYGGGWTYIYWVDAEYFDGTYANDSSSSSSPPTAINVESDMWNAEAELTVTEMLFACTTQNDADFHYWYYNDSSPYTWFTGTGSYGYQTISSDASSTTAGTCMSTHKPSSGYGFLVIEDGSCGSCNTMLYGMYHYTSGGGCNSTSNTYGSHTSPWDGRGIAYPICGGQQTSNGEFFIAVR